MGKLWRFFLRLILAILMLMTLESASFVISRTLNVLRLDGEEGKMPKQSGLLQRQKEKENAAMIMGINIGMQYAIDTLNISLYEADGWGYDRQMRLMEIWRENRRYYEDALDFRKVEADVYRDKLDKGLATVIGGKAELIPFAKRYPHLRETRYGK